MDKLSSPDSPNLSRAAWRWDWRAAIVFAVLVACLPAIGAMLRGLPAHSPWTRPFLLDEFHTLLLVQEPSIGSLLSKLSQGGDYNPPGLFLILRLWATLWGVSEASFRAFSTIAMIIGLVGVNSALRTSVSRWTALTASVLLFAGMPLLQAESLNARFYSLWFAEVAWLVALLSADWRNAPTRRGGPIGISIGIAAMSTLVCLTHYFGVFAITAIALGQFAIERIARVPGTTSAYRLALLGVGPLCLLACLPMFLGQRAALEVPTWIAPSGRAAIDELLSPFFQSITLTSATLALALSVIVKVFQGGKSPSASITLDFGSIRPLGAAWGLLALPFIMLIFHFLIQPVSVARYAIPTAVGVAGFTAVILAGCDRRILIMLAGGASALPLVAGSIAARSDDPRTDEVLRQIIQFTQGDGGQEMIYVYKGRGIGYQAWRYSGLSADSFRLLYPHGEEPVSNFDRLERSVAARMHKLFNVPATTSTEELLSGPPFILVSDDPLAAIEGQFPRAEIIMLSAGQSLNAFRVDPSSIEPASPQR